MFMSDNTKKDLTRRTFWTTQAAVACKNILAGG
jgi:hypothetical protein